MKIEETDLSRSRELIDIKKDILKSLYKPVKRHYGKDVVIKHIVIHLDNCSNKTPILLEIE